ncbi:MAG: LamG domain-containing protein [Bacteroidetes bacterium]|nr:LamG domain-containing protein [Bacteroidota bacterium]
MINVLIEKYYTASGKVERTNSPRRKLISIVNFFRECEDTGYYPPDFAFLEDFVPVLLGIFRNAGVNFIDPSYLRDAKDILLLSSEYYEDKIVLNEIDTVVNLINMQLLKMYFHLGELEEGLVILNKMIDRRETSSSGRKEILAPKADAGKGNETAGSKYALIKPDIFRKSRALEILEEIKYELERLNGYSYDEINTILVEEENTETGDANLGLILPMHCRLAKQGGTSGRIEFENNTDLTEHDFRESLENIRNTVRLLLHGEGVHKEPYGKILLGYDNMSNVYKGTSFLFAGSVISFCKVYNERLSRKRFAVSSSSAFTGSLDRHGSLQKLPSDSLKAKINTAFFSWIKNIILPAENAEEAKEIIAGLNRIYPNKTLNVTGLSSLNKITDISDVIITEEDSKSVHVRKLLKRYSLQAVLMLSLIILVTGIYAAYMFLPRDIKPLPVTENPMYLIYAPDRDTNWIFQNENYFGGDTIDFGDVAIGDLWFPKLDLLNNSRKKERFVVEIEGKDKDEFEVLWRSEGNQPDAPLLNPDFSQRLYIKFRPINYDSLGPKLAKLKIYSLENAKSYKEITLKGKSVKYSNGYSLNFKNGNEQMVLNNKVNVLKDEFTVSFWIKPLLDNYQFKENNFLILRNDDGSTNKFYITVEGDSSIVFYLMTNKSYLTPEKYKSINKVKYNDWNYVAVTYNIKEILIILNNERTIYENKYNSLKLIPDCISIGGSKTPDKRNLEKPTKTNYSFLLNNLKIWNKSEPLDFLVKDMWDKNLSDSKNLFLQYDFDEMNYESVYDLSKNELWATIYGGLTRKMDSPEYPSVKNEYRDKSNENNILYLKNKGVMVFTKNLFQNPSSFSIQIDAKYINPDTSYDNHCFDISHPDFINRFMMKSNVLELVMCDNIDPYSKIEKRDYRIDDKWHRYIFSYSLENDYSILYIDGKEYLKLDSLKKKYDISRWFYNISFGNLNFFYSPRFITKGICIDNAKIFNRALTPIEVLNNSTKGLLAFWTFEKREGDIVFDEVNELPAKIWNDYEFKQETVAINN